jgi:hypothetical protein
MPGSSGSHTLTVALPAANPGHSDRISGHGTSSGRVFIYTFSRVRLCARRNRPPADAEAVKEPALRDPNRCQGPQGSSGNHTLNSRPSGRESWPPCPKSRPQTALGKVSRYTSIRARLCARRNRPRTDAEAVKEPALRDQLGTNGSAGGKLPAGKETSRRPWRSASAATRKALTNSA